MNKRLLSLGSEMPKSKGRGGRKTAESAFVIYMVLLIIAAALLLLLVLITLKIIDPVEDYTIYIFEAIIGIMLAAQFTETWDFRKKTMANAESIVAIKTKLEYMEKNLAEIKAKLDE